MATSEISALDTDSSIKMLEPEPLTQSKSLEDGDRKKMARESTRIMMFKITKQASLVLAWISIGFYVEIVGPTLKDLMYRVRQNYDQISQALAWKSIGSVVGAPLGGVLCSRFNKHVDLLLSLTSLVAAACTFCIPWFTSVEGVDAMMFFAGVSESITNAGGNAMVLKLWGSKSASPMQSLHFGFGVGAMISPQIAKPFLGHETNETLENCTSDLTTTYYPFRSNGSSECSYITVMQDSRIQVAYIIAACVPLIFGIISFIFYFVKPPKGFQLFTGQMQFLKVLNPGACAQGNMCFGVQMLILLFLFYIHVIGIERAVGKFLSSYLRERGFSIDKATNLNSAFWIGFTVGRFSGTILSIWIKPLFMLSIQCTCLLVITLVLAFFGSSNDTVLWVFIVAFAWFESQVFPSGMAWANNYMEMTSMAVCIVMMGAFSGGFIYQRLTGFLFEVIGYKVFLFVPVGYAVCLGLFFVPLVVIARRQGPRVFDEEQIETDGEVKSETHALHQF